MKKKLQNDFVQKAKVNFYGSFKTLFFLIVAFFFFANTNTIKAQATCTAAINIASLPYTATGLSNCGNTNSSPTCLSSTYFSGDDYFLKYTPSANQCINATVTIPTSITYSGFAITTGCPAASATCVVSATGANKTSFTLTNVSLTAGTTYYFIVSGGSVAPKCMGFGINISDCSQPCIDATNITSLPYNGTGLTNCGAGTAFSGTPACLDAQHFGGEQKIFKYTPSANQCINTSVTIPNDATYSGFAILDKCPLTAGAACVGIQSGTFSNSFAINSVSLTAGNTYYFIISGGSSGGPLCMAGWDFKITDCAAVCASGTNIPSVPFTQNGVTNCGAGANISGTPACLDPKFFAGEDYVFKYTPTANICINSKATYTTAIPWGSGFAILDKCPGTTGAACVAVKTGDFQVGSLALSNVSLTAGTTYYFVISGGEKSIASPPNECMGFNFSVTECPLPPDPLPTTPQGVECGGNLGFEDGDLSQWTGYTGTNTQNPTTAGLIPGVTSVNGALGTCHSNPAAGVGTRQTRTNGAGFDPNTDNVVPVVAPGCRTSSVRIGNHESGYQSESMEKTFLVTTSNVLFTYLYAVVLEDPGHIDANQPRFEITMKDGTANVITCGGVYSITSTNASSDGFVNATAPTCGGNAVWYKNWTAVGTDLTPYLGQNITIKFTTSDCTQGGHFGYAYVDTYCKPKEITGTTVCTVGGSITLTAPAGFSSYKWHTGTSTGAIVGTGQTLVVNPAVDGAVYTVEFKSIVGTSCTSYVTDTIKVISANAVADTTICSGATGTKKLVASSNDPAATYSWTSTPAGFTSTSATPTVTLPAVTTVYKVTVSSNLGCTITKQVTITVNPPPTITVNSPTVCPNVAATLTASGGTTYVWSTGATTTSITVSPAVTTSYTVTGSALGGCSSSAQAVVTIATPPTATASANSPCEGASLNLTSTGGTSWSWTGPGGYTSTSQNPSRSPATVAMNGIYTVIVTTAGCTGSATVNVTVNPLPVVTASSATICPGGTATLTAGGATTYLWSTSATTSSITVTPGATTSYTVTGTSAGCSALAVGSVTVGSTLTVNVNSPIICAGAVATLNATGAATYSWSTGETTTSITVTPVSTTTYSITGTSAGCSGSGTATVTVNPLPTPTAAANTPCAGAAINLTSTDGTSWSWTGPNSYTSTSQNPTIVSSTTAMSGVYTVTTTAAGCTATATVNVTVNPLPVVTVNSPTICLGETTTLTASGATTYLWSTGATTTSISVLPAITTSYTVTGTTLTCTAQAVAVVTVNPPCGVNVTTTSPTVCNGACATVTATANSGTPPYTFLWATGGETTTSITVCPATTTTSYTVTVTDNVGNTATATASITVNPNPVVNVANAAICFGGTTTLTASGADTYTWSPATGLNPSAGTTVTANPTSTTTYTITGTTTATGCTGSTTAVVTVNPIPTITVPGASICVGGSTPLTANGADTYVWSPATDLSGSTGTTVTASPGSTSTYTVTGTTIAGCTGSTTVVVTVGALVADAGPDKSICSGSSTTFNATGGSGYSWSPGTGLSSTTISNPTVSATVTTTYTVTVTSGICIDTDDVVVIVDPPLVLNIAGFPPKCAGGSDGQVVVIPSGGDSIYSYQWSPVTGTTASVNGVTAGTYTVTVTDKFGCTASASTVIIDPTPVVGTTSVLTAHCGLSDGSATVSSVSGGTGTTYTYSWNTSPVQTTQTASNISAGTYVVTISDANGCTITVSAVVPDASGIGASIVTFKNVNCSGGNDGNASSTGIGGTPAYTYLWSNGQTTTNITNLTAGTYSVTITDLYGCSARTSVIISQPTPVVLTSTNGVMCPLASATMTTNGTGGTGTIGYSWNTSGLTGTSVILSPAASTTYTITGTDANGCTGTTTAKITVNSVPTISVPNDTICFGKSTALTASGATFYSWSPATGLSSSTGSPLTANPTGTTTYTVIGTDGITGCTNSTTVIVIVNALPVVTIPPDSICPGDSTTLKASGTSTYTWSPGTGLDTTAGATVKVKPTATTTYTVTGTSPEGCTSTTPVIVTVNPKPKASFSSNPTSATFFDPAVNFTDHTGGSTVWSWTFGDWKNSGSFDKNPSFTYPDSIGKYKVRLIVENKFGCIDTTYGDVIIKGEYTFFIPNTFTPNGDGNNDGFAPKGTGIDITDYDLWIFDRWGNMIWHTETWGEQWDGRANYGDDVAQIDTYVWKVHVREKDSQIKHNYIGHVNIVK